MGATLLAVNEQNRVTQEAIGEFFPHVSYAHRFLVLPEHRCVYVKNAKAGVSTIGLWMARIHRNEPEFVPDQDTNRSRGVPTASQTGWPRTLRMLEGEGFRFSFVRHPLRRFESAYRDKIAGVADDQWRSEIANTLGLRADQPVTLEHFVAAVEGQDPLRMDPPAYG
jgi:sulfotransferase famil protein